MSRSSNLAPSAAREMPAAPLPQKKSAADLYKPLPGAKRNRIKLASTNPFTPAYVQKILVHPNPASVYASRVKGRHILLENPARESKAKQERDGRRKRHAEQARNTVKGEGGRPAAEKGVWKFDKRQAKFDLFLPLHHLWMGYMSELLALPAPPEKPTHTPIYTPNSATMHAKLVKADYHGALVTVAEAKNPSLVGLSGIVIHETENAFRVVTKENRAKLLPKQNSIFTFAVPLYSSPPPGTANGTPPDAYALDPDGAASRGIVLDEPHLMFTLYANQFRFRASERAGRKFKAKESIEL